MSDLRDRIATAACGATSAGKLFPWNTLSEPQKDAWRAMADAVIAELSLRRDTVGLIHRWVTEWETTND
jgi:hypothetical protein